MTFNNERIHHPAWHAYQERRLAQIEQDIAQLRADGETDDGIEAVVARLFDDAPATIGTERRSEVYSSPSTIFDDYSEIEEESFQECCRLAEQAQAAARPRLEDWLLAVVLGTALLCFVVIVVSNVPVVLAHSWSAAAIFFGIIGFMLVSGCLLVASNFHRPDWSGWIRRYQRGRESSRRLARQPRRFWMFWRQ